MFFIKKKKKEKVFRPRLEKRMINIKKTTVRFECKSGVVSEEEVEGTFHQYYNVNNGTLYEPQIGCSVREAENLIHTKGHSNTNRAPRHTVKDVNGVYHYRQQLVRASIVKTEDFEQEYEVCVGFDTLEIESEA